MKKAETIAARIANTLSVYGKYRRHFATTETEEGLFSEGEAEAAIFQGQFPDRDIEVHRERIADISEDGFFQVWAHFVTAYEKPIPAAFYNEEI